MFPSPGRSLRANGHGYRPPARSSTSSGKVPMPRRPVLLALSAVAFAAATAPAAALSPRLPCRTAGAATKCGLDVPLDHSGATPGTERVGFTVLRATGPRTGTLAILLGGPGQAGTPIVGELAAIFAGLRADHDLVIVDQRGTGASNALTCSDLTRPE